MTSQQQLVCDCSTLANFKQWAQAISSFFATAGWLQSSDTGQVNWSSIATVPGNGAYVYEIWQPNDGLTNFFAKVEYGNITGSANNPTVRLTLSSGTNGAGVANGLVLGPYTTNGVNFTAPSAVTQYECNFSGAAGRMCVMLWRNGINNCQQSFCIERSVNSSGTYTGTHVTLVVGGWASGVNDLQWLQQTLVFGVAVAPLSGNTNRTATGSGGLIARLPNAGANSSGAFNNSIPFDTTAPSIGYFDYPLTCCGIVGSADIVEGVTFTATIYGTLHTYMPSKNSVFGMALPCQLGANAAYCMRFD